MKTEIHNSDDCKKLHDDELAKERAGIGSNSQKAILIDIEIAHRARIHQHELDLKLIGIQSKSLKISTIITAACTIAGAVVGTLLTILLQWLLKQ